MPVKGSIWPGGRAVVRGGSGSGGFGRAGVTPSAWPADGRVAVTGAEVTGGAEIADGAEAATAPDAEVGA